MASRSRGPLLLWLLLILQFAAPLAAQNEEPTPPAPPHRPSTWHDDAETIGLNVLIGATVAALARGVRGKPVLRGLFEGAAGGALMYAGKRVAAARMSGAGLIGRPISAAGASVVRNSSLGNPALSQLVLPVWVVRLYVMPGGDPRVRARVDLPGSLATVYSLWNIDWRFSLSASLSAGAPVFYRQLGASGTAQQGAGVVWLTNPENSDADGPVFGHERVHVLQYDAAFIVVAEPTERWLFARHPAGEQVGRYFDLGLNLPAWWLLNQLIPYEDRPWEREAYFMAGK